MMNNTIYNYLSKNGIDISRAHGSILRDLKDYPSYYWGLKENNTREFMELCQKEKIPIIGIDVLTNENDFYELSFDIWCYQRKEDEKDDSYLLNSIKGASDYIKHFHQKKGLLFSFTVDEMLAIKIM